MVQPIVLLNRSHPMLSTPTNNVDVAVDKDKIEQLLLDLKDTLKSVGGLGLAANQISIPQSVCIVNINDLIVSMVNPEIVWTNDVMMQSNESCLSLPDLSAIVSRYERIRVSFINPDNDWLVDTIELDFPNSVIVQHEVDHLTGITIVDNLSQLAKSLVTTKLKRIARGNVPMNYVGLIWRQSTRQWALVGNKYKLYEMQTKRLKLMYDAIQATKQLNSETESIDTNNTILERVE